MEGSALDLAELTAGQIANLALLGRVWGFLKYHHRVVTAGRLDWDHKLLEVLPSVARANGELAGRQLMSAWALELGTPRRLRVPATPPEAPAHFSDLDWLRDQAILGPELASFLVRVHEARSTAKKQFYVHHAPGVGNPIFTNEDDYEDLEVPDAGFRLLALFRFWNIIEYWSPYRDLVEGDWWNVLSEFIPRLGAALSRDHYIRELILLLARVNDTHTNLWGSLDRRPPTGPCRVPVTVRFVNDTDGHPRAVVSAVPKDLRPTEGDVVRGDVIVSVDGVAVEDLVREWEPYYAASNQPVRLRDIGRSMLRGPAGQAELEISRDGRPLRVVVDRQPTEPLADDERFHDRPGKTFQLLSPEVAYLRLSSVSAADCGTYVAAAAGTKGLVIDLRNYPSEFVPVALGEHLVREESPFARFTTAAASNPGVFTMGPPLSLSPEGPHYEGRVVILVDEVTQSQAEYTTLALRQARGALVVGSTTAGADGNISAVPLAGGLRTTISGIGIFTADGQPTQRVGIAVDVRIEPTIAGLRDGRDELLEEAVRQILGFATSEEHVRALTADQQLD